MAQFVAGEQFWDTRNPIEKPDLVTPEILKQTYLVPTQRVGSRLTMQRHGWHEYGNYIGTGSAIALVGGLLWVLLRRSPSHHWFGVSLALTTVMLFVLSLGEFSPYAPAVLSQQLPLFENFRIPSRYTIPFLQFAALTLAWGFQSIVTRYGLTRPARVAVAVLCLIASAHLVAVNRWNFRGVFNQPPFDTTFRWMAGPREIATDQSTNAYGPGSPMLRALVEHRAFFHCYESLQLYRASDADRAHLFVQGRRKDQRRLVHAQPVGIQCVWRTGAGEGVDELQLGPGWTSSAGPIELIGRPGKLAIVTIAPGQTGRYAFAFTPPGLYTGITIFALAALASAAMWRRAYRDLFFSFCDHDSDRIAFRRHREPRHRAKLVRRGIEHFCPARAASSPGEHLGAAGHQDGFAIRHPGHVAIGRALDDLREPIDLFRIDVDLLDPVLAGLFSMHEAHHPGAGNAMQRTANAVCCDFAFAGA